MSLGQLLAFFYLVILNSSAIRALFLRHGQTFMVFVSGNHGGMVLK